MTCNMFTMFSMRLLKYITLHKIKTFRKLVRVLCLKNKMLNVQMMPCEVCTYYGFLVCFDFDVHTFSSRNLLHILCSVYSYGNGMQDT